MKEEVGDDGKIRPRKGGKEINLMTDCCGEEGATKGTLEKGGDYLN